jgi:hypothetical protein
MDIYTLYAGHVQCSLAQTDHEISVVGMANKTNTNEEENDVGKQALAPRAISHRQRPRTQLLMMCFFHLITTLSRISRSLRTDRSQSLVLGRSRLLSLGPLSAIEYAACDGSDQRQACDTATNNNGYFVLLEGALHTKWIGILELNSATDDLSLWRWIHRVKTVLFEAVGTNV